MNVYFNDLTLHDVPSLNLKEMEAFGCVWARFRKETKRSFLIAGITPNEMIKRSGCEMNRKHKELIFSIFKAPYIDHEKDNHTEIEEEQYAGADFYLLSDQETRMSKSSLLGWVAIKKSLFLGFPKNAFWRKCCYLVEEQMPISGRVVHEVNGITMEQHFDDEKIKDWIDKNYKAEPIRTDLSPANKHRKMLPAHHGIKELNHFADLILQSEYVLEIVNSIDHMPYCKSLIGKIHPDGCMDVCLYWTVAHYALCIRTTAENKYQGEAIKRLLEKEFC